MSKDTRNFKQWHSIFCTLIMITRSYENTSPVHATWPARLIFLDLNVCALRPTQYMPLCENCLLKTPCFAKRAIQCKTVQATINNLFLNNLKQYKTNKTVICIVYNSPDTYRRVTLLTCLLINFQNFTRQTQINK